MSHRQKAHKYTIYIEYHFQWRSVMQQIKNLHMTDLILPPNLREYPSIQPVSILYSGVAIVVIVVSVHGMAHQLIQCWILTVEGYRWLGHICVFTAWDFKEPCLLRQSYSVFHHDNRTCKRCSLHWHFHQSSMDCLQKGSLIRSFDVFFISQVDHQK